MADSFEGVEDDDLVERWRAGERRAGSTLFDRHFPAIFAFFRNRCPEQAEDLAQRTFLACVDQQDQIRDLASVRAYLFGIARRLLLMEFRTRGRRPQLDPASTSLADVGASPSAIVAERAEHRLLLAALRRIPIDDQMLLELYHWEGMTAPELAESLGIGIPAVRSRLRRAMTRLKKTVESLAETADLARTTTANFDHWIADLGVQRNA